MGTFPCLRLYLQLWKVFVVQRIIYPTSPLYVLAPDLSKEPLHSENSILVLFFSFIF